MIQIILILKCLPCTIECKAFFTAPHYPLPSWSSKCYGRRGHTLCTLSTNYPTQMWALPLPHRNTVAAYNDLKALSIPIATGNIDMWNGVYRSLLLFYQTKKSRPQKQPELIWWWLISKIVVVCCLQIYLDIKKKRRRAIYLLIYLGRLWRAGSLCRYVKGG